jgi:hypothetical protein
MAIGNDFERFDQAVGCESIRAKNGE